MISEVEKEDERPEREGRSHVQLGKFGLRGETLDRLDEVLVRVGVAGEDLAHDGDELEGVLSVHPERESAIASSRQQQLGVGQGVLNAQNGGT